MCGRSCIARKLGGGRRSTCYIIFSVMIKPAISDHGKALTDLVELAGDMLEH